MSKWIIRVIILLGFFGLLIIPAGVSAATVGTQEFFLPLPSNITQDIFKTITPEEWGDPGGDEYMHYVV